MLEFSLAVLRLRVCRRCSNTYYFGVAAIYRSKVIPESLKSSCVGDNLTVVTAIIVRIDDGICTLGGDKVDNIGVWRQIG